MEEIDEWFDLKGSGEGEAAVFRPCGDDGGEGADAAVRVVGGALAVGFPDDGSFRGDLEAVAVFPPGVPEAAEVFAGVGRGEFVEVGCEESGGAEEDGFGGGFLVFDGGEGCALGEEFHREGVSAIAEGFGGGLEECGIAPVGIGCGEEAAGFVLGAVLRGFFQQAINRAGGHAFERGDAAAGAGDGDFAQGTVEGIAEGDLGDDDARDFAVFAGACEERAGFGLEDDVEDDVAEVGVGGVAVGFPAGGVGVEFERSGFEDAIDFHGGLGEVGAGAAVPFAELDDVDFAAVGGAEVAAESAGEPEGLEFEFGREWRGGPFLECEWRMPDRL